MRSKLLVAMTVAWPLISSMPNLVTAVGTANANDTVQVLPGTSTDAGSLYIDRAGTTAATVVSFDGTAGVTVDGGGGTGEDVVYVLGTDGSDEFTAYRQIPLPRMGRVDTSFGPSVFLDQFGSDETSTLALYGTGGDDDFAITPLDTVRVSVIGGEPSASDSVIVKGSNADDAITVEPTTDSSAEVAVNAQAVVLVQQIEHLTIDGTAGNDVLTVLNDDFPNVIELTPGHDRCR